MFDSSPWILWANKAGWAPMGACALYTLAVVHAPEGVKQKDSALVRRSLVAWNVGMAFFSAWCTAVALPHLVNGPRGIATRGLVSAICSDALWFSTGVEGRVAVAFTMSKFIELGDTAFLVLRKRNLTHLHTFHHAATLVLTWALFERRASTGLIFIAMNAFIHTVMYTYYAAVLFPRVRAVLLPHSHWITVMQITQMLIGIFVNLLAAREIIAGRYCQVSPICVCSAGLLYSIYACMFVLFAIQRAKPKGA